ncbi:MAG: hypothetical protein AAF548_05425 [Actinomycetota bacterium]
MRIFGPAVLVVGLFVGAWYLAGAWGEPLGDDHLIEPWLTGEARGVVGRAGLAVALLGAAATWRTRPEAWGAWGPPTTLLAVWSGATYGVVTGPVVGANIGGGLMLLATPVVVVACAVWTLVALLRFSRRG